MSIKEYELKPLAPLPPSPIDAPYDWKSDPFYNTDVVLGIDIGLEGIGIWLRKGPKPLYARTFLFETPDAAPLQNRRGLRAGRRCRQAEKRREIMLKKFCKDFGLPWVEITDKGNDDGPFRFRWIATRKDVEGLRDIRAFSACLRHIIRHRGYDWHAPEEGGLYPWGDSAKPGDAIEWARTAFCQPENAEKLRYLLSDCGWKDKEREAFETVLNRAVERCGTEGINAVLANHFSQPKNNLRLPVRRHNFPREMVWGHLEEIVRKHPQFLGGKERLEAALSRLREIINDHRKEPGELADRKVNPCPFAKPLFKTPAPKCDSSKNQHVRRFKLLEFLANRSFVRKDGARLLPSPKLFDWLLENLLKQDIQALDSDGKIQRARMNMRDFKKQFLANYDPSGETELAADSQSHNGDYFGELADLLWPKMSKLAGRASMCARSAEALFEYAKQDGFEAPQIASRLKERRFEYHGKMASLYEIRQTAAAGFGIYPQVEFLLGRRRKKDTKAGVDLAVPGKLRQIFAKLIANGALPPGKTAPDYAVIEQVGDIPRNKEQAKEYQKQQKAKREFKDKLREKFKGLEREDLSGDEASKRLILFDQQRGICPYTGDSLGDNPRAHELEIDHVFPRSRGGISQMDNLVLTHRKTNGGLKREQTPYEAFGGKENTPEWRLIRDRVQKMQWNSQKREFFLRAEDTPPDWGNMTRVAQLARQLRAEVARWMDIADDDAKTGQRIGTPTGYQTSVCREAWADKLPPDYWPKKNRDNLRHHMWDAAVLSHIPPGKGLNHVRCHGIFWSKTAQGNIKMLALPGLGPDLEQFEKETAGRCLVDKIKSANNKQSRFQQTIYSPPDENGVMWARDSIDKLADKDNLLEWLREAGIDENQLPRRRFDEWRERRQAQFFTHEEAFAAVEALALPPDQHVPAPVFEQWWADGLRSDKKKVTDKSLRALLAMAHVPKALVTDQQLSSVLFNRGKPGNLTRRDGTIIRGVSRSASNMTPMAVVPHRNHKGETIGFKLATESFIRAEIWTTETRDKNGRPKLEFHRRLIPHPRGLKNLRLRVLQCSGARLSWERALTDQEIIELGLNDHPEVKRLRNDYQKAVRLCEKAAIKAAKAQPGLLSADLENASAKPMPPAISLRKIFTGLPPFAKRLTNDQGADISRFAKGDLLLVPLSKEADICQPGHEAHREYWFRIAALKANGQIQLLIAERKQPKALTEQEIKEGKRLSDNQDWLIKAGLKQPKDNELIAFLLRRTRCHDQPPHIVK